MRSWWPVNRGLGDSVTPQTGGFDLHHQQKVSNRVINPMQIMKLPHQPQFASA